MADIESKRTSLARSFRRGYQALRGNRDTTATQILCYRMNLFTALSVAGTAFYSIHDYLFGSYYTSAIHGYVCLGAITALFIHRRLKRPVLAANTLLFNVVLLLGVVPFWDGTIHAPGLWMLVFLPFGAAFLIGERGVIRYALCAFLCILANTLAAPYFGRDAIISREALQWTQMRIVAILIFSGVGFMSAGASLRKQKTLRARTRALEQELQAANVAEHSKSVFLATMSHEIRMPIQGIQEFTRRTSHLTYPEPLKNKLEKMRSSALRLLRSLDAILDLARVEARSVELRRDEFSLGRLLEQQHQHFAARAAQKGLTLHTHLGVAPQRYLGDPNRIGQILSALIDNAIKFSDGGAIHMRLAAPSNPGIGPQSNQELRISVQDQGIGMNPTQLARAFGSFEQVHNQDQQRGGCGLGLAIAHRLAKQMGGSLAAHSEEGRGSTFTLSLSLPVVAKEPKLEDSLSAELGLRERAVPAPTAAQTKAPPPVDEDPLSRQTLLPLARVIVPYLMLLALKNLVQSDPNAGLWQVLALGGILASLFPFRSKFGQRIPISLFIASLALGVCAQSLIDGDAFSETLWLVGLLPLLATYLVNVAAALAVLLASMSFVLLMGSFEPVYDLEVWVTHQSLGWTLALRVASLFAHTGAALVITRGTEGAIRTMEQHQQSVALLNREAKQSNQDKKRFLTRISEEIGTPIREVVDLAGQVAKASELDAQQRDLVTTIEQCGSRLSQLLERTFQSAANGERFPPREIAPFDLAQLLRDLRQLFGPRASRSGLEIQLRNPDALRWVQGDATRVLEILNVLLSNAIRFSHRGTVTIEVRQTLGEQGQGVAIEIRDQGKGIEPKQLRGIVDKARATEASSAPSLSDASALVRAMVSAKHMGGSLCAQSELGRGSRFLLRLPLTSEATQASSAA